MSQQAWKLHQSGPNGEQIVLVAKDILRVEQPQLGMVYILHKAEDWNIFVVNKHSRQVYSATFDAFLNEQLEEESISMKDLEALNGGAIENTFMPLEKRSQTKVAGTAATEYALRQSWTAPKYSWTTEFHVWFADDIALEHNAALSLIHMFGYSLCHDRVILRVTSQHGVVLDTQKIERTQISAHDLLTVAGNFEVVDSVAEVEDDSYVDEANMTIQWPEQ